MSKSTKKISNRFKIDSLRIEVPVEDIEVSQLFYDKYVLINADTGEPVENFHKKQALEHSHKGVTYYSWLYSRFDQKQKKNIEYLAFLVNAKMLLNNYFDGIVNENIYILYKTLIDLKHFNMSFEKFLNCYVYDVDFCKDFTSINDTMLWFYKKYTYTKKYKTHAFIRDERFETLQFNTRLLSRNASPYAKYYSKYWECKAKKRVHTLKFYKENDINPRDLYNVYRFEYNMKNNKQFMRFHKTENILHKVLNIPNENHKKVSKNIHLMYTDGYKMEIEKSDYTAIPMLLRYIIEKSELDYIDLIDDLVEYLDPCAKSTRTRVIRQLKSEYNVKAKPVTLPLNHEEGVNSIEMNLFGEIL